MKAGKSASVRALVVAITLALAAASPALAQGRGGGGPPGGGGPGGGMGGGMGGPGGGMGNPPFPGGGNAPMGRNPVGSEPPQPGQGQRPQTADGVPHPGLQLGPPGRWWDDKSMVRNLKLRPDQQARMDAIFEQNRPALLTRLTNAQQADAQMEELSRSSTPDESALLAQIDRVAQAHAELDKATTHMLLQIRKEMDLDQIKRLEKATQR